MITHTAFELLSLDNISSSTASSPIITGLSSLDNEAGGLAKGLVLLGGRPSPCYQSLAKYLALQVSKQADRKVVWFTSVYSGPFLMRKFIEEGCKREDLAENENLIIVDTPRLTVEMIEAEIKRLFPRELSNQGMVVIDEQAVFSFILRHDGNRLAQMAESLRELGLERNFTVLLNCMLHKKLEKRAFHYPKISDLKRYDQFFMRADQVIITFYPHTYSEHECGKYWELNLFKNRTGPRVRQDFATPVSALF